MAHQRAFFSEGKTTYYINGQRFFNSSQGERDGKEKAIEYCLNNFLNQQDIIKFDSQLECNRYEYLMEQQRLGNISNLGHHYILKIQDEFINANGDTIPPITYNADFIYIDNLTSQRVVEDVKGASLFQDTRFELMKQVFDYKFKEKGLYVRVILWRNKQWVEWHIGEKKKPQKLITKQRQEIKDLRLEKHQREMLDNKTERLTKRYNELIAKPKLTKREKERLEEIKIFLKK